MRHRVLSDTALRLGSLLKDAMSCPSFLFGRIRPAVRVLKRLLSLRLRCQIGEHGTRETKANELAVCTADMLPFRDAHFNDILRRQGDAKHAR
jgi:hypothetical protein